MSTPSHHLFVRKQFKRLSCAIVSLLITSTTLTAAAKIKLPELSIPSQATLSLEQENRLGRAFMQAVRAQTNLFYDLASTTYLTQLGNQLGMHASPHNNFTFFIVDDPSINAFAGPGGYVGLNTGLMTTTKNEAELAAVLAHEITHVTQRHIARGLENSNQSTWPSIGAIVAALLLRGRIDSAVTTGAILGAAAGKMQHTINFTRRFEREADRIGMRVLFDTGFNPEAMSSFFARMQNRTLDYGDPRLKLLRSHPVTEDRIADSQNRAHHYPKRPNQLNKDYNLIKSRIRVITAPTNQDILNTFHAQYQQKPRDEVSRYGYALALARNHQYQTAQHILTSLTKEHPSFPLYTLSLAETQLLTNPDQAIQTLQHGYSQFPHYSPIMITYSQYLLDHKQANQARQILDAIQHSHKNDPMFYGLLAQAQGGSHHLIDAYQSRAEQFILYNHLERAVIQLHQAMKLAHDQPAIQDRLKKKIASLQQEIIANEG